MRERWEMTAGHVRWMQPGSRAVGCPTTSFALLGYPRCRRNGGHERGAPLRRSCITAGVLLFGVFR